MLPIVLKYGNHTRHLLTSLNPYNVGRKCEMMKHFSGLKTMTIHSKIRILECIAGRTWIDNLSEAEAIMAIRIMNERKKNPNFLSEEIKDA